MDQDALDDAELVRIAGRHRHFADRRGPGGAVAQRLDLRRLDEDRVAADSIAAAHRAVEHRGITDIVEIGLGVGDERRPGWVIDAATKSSNFLIVRSQMLWVHGR